MPVVLRNFLYLDERLTSMYLSQLEGGVYDEEQQSESQGRERSGGASAKAGPLQGQIARGRSGERSISRTMRQTPEAAFGRLESLLEDQGGAQWLEAFDDAIWQQLRRGEVLVIEGTVSVPQLYQISELASGIGPLLDLMRLFGEEVPNDTEEAIEGMTKVGQVLQEVPVVARAAGAPKHRFVCPLNREFLREDLGALDGECIVMGSMQRRLKPRENYSLLDTLGLGPMPRDERRRIEREIKRDRGMADLIVSPPAAILTPLAIYR